ncbi:YkgJ family cysteine cluster protein [Desulfopila sp. IMCC35008]|uniref:YkgJ family cysteine cluster protein n=1 Tax=Desulfopila sp. IMCC35008 TaxID=2653858 RepID=UPI0013D889A1|nr:YkgJ family cysteine cluster protein [Desulfopila sp. IMCC35008]
MKQTARSTVQTINLLRNRPSAGLTPMNIKQEILKIIYTSFSNWSSKQPQACTKGCSTCCTQNVNVTAAEAELILDYLVGNKLEQTALRGLSATTTPSRPLQTINEFAADCFAGKESEQEQEGSRDSCPFLKDDLCTIYPARPFGCRCFLSQHVCTRTSPALVTNEYLTACTVISQLVEHLGQGEYYGNLLDVIPAMLDISRYHSIAELATNATKIQQARSHTLTAKPLPGFLLPPEDSDSVTPLIETIFKARVEGKTVEAILNGQ